MKKYFFTEKNSKKYRFFHKCLKDTKSNKTFLKILKKNLIHFFRISQNIKTFWRIIFNTVHFHKKKLLRATSDPRSLSTSDMHYCGQGNKINILPIMRGQWTGNKRQVGPKYNFEISDTCANSKHMYTTCYHYNIILIYNYFKRHTHAHYEKRIYWKKISRANKIYNVFLTIISSPSRMYEVVGFKNIVGFSGAFAFNTFSKALKKIYKTT